MTQLPTETGDELSRAGGAAPPEALGLVIAWSPAEPGRIGEVAIIPPARPGVTFLFGRGSATGSEPEPRLGFARNRAGVVDPRPALSASKISRVQLRIRLRGLEYLEVENVGRCPLFHNSRRADSATAVVGDTLQLGQELLLLCVRRRAWVHSLNGHALPMPFGVADPHGIVGESPTAWEFRRQLAFVGARPEHVLIAGESGTGKELAARAVHALSPRAGATFVARNAATFPEALVDAELFGHAKNYPNVGMPERQGLIASAAGATLFLDEIAELSQALQTHLLRVLDRGEYQRLGETLVRTSDFRLIAATNRPAQLRSDLLARLKLSLSTPSLNDRREDIPLLVVHLLRSIATANADIGKRLFPQGESSPEPRVRLSFIDALVRRTYLTHVRELEGLLWQALLEGSEGSLDFPSRPPETGTPTPSDDRAHQLRRSLTPTTIEAALNEHDGSLERTWRALGLSSRHALARLISKHGLKKPKS
jgi:two-component system nitrogen regulation response regulator GlnG/two-component system response regulator HydG